MIGDESTNDFLPKAKTELMLFCKLTRLLENQTADTIDDFIAQNPSVAEQAKISVAVQFFKKLYDYDSSLGKFIIRKLDNRNLLEERNWVHLLINLIRQGIRLQKVSPENPIQIITFNYDNGLEFILEKQFSNTEVELPNWRDVIKIHHIHGHMSDLPDNTLEPFKICQNWANSINVVHEENILPSVQRARVEASEALRKARNIYVCGFAFSGANIRLLGLNKIAGPYGGQNIHYCNYDNNVGLKHAVKRLNDHIYNVKNSGDDKISKFSRTPIELSGSRDNPMTITNWFYTGTPGELPS